MDDLSPGERDLDFRCTGCGYGVAVRTRLPERCPMCGGLSWASALRPFGTRDVEPVPDYLPTPL